MNNITPILKQNISAKSNECSQHELSLIYYCKTCKEALCPDCCMINSNHKSHQLTKLDSVFDENMTHINKLLSSLNSKSSQYSNLITCIDTIVISVDDYIERKEKEILQIYETMKKNLITKGDDIKKKLLLCKKEISIKLDNVKRKKNDLNMKIMNNNKKEIIENFKEIIEYNENFEIDKKVVDSVIRLNVEYEISKEINPQYEKYEYFYIGVAKEKEKIYYSKKFNLFGQCFQVKGFINKQNNLSLYLKLNKENINIKEKNILFLIEINNYKNKNNNYIKENKVKITSGDSVGYSNIISLNRLKSEGYINQQGKIKIKFSVKPFSYLDQCYILESYFSYFNSNGTKLRRINSLSNLRTQMRLGLNESKEEKEVENDREIEPNEIIEENAPFVDNGISVIENNTNIYFDDSYCNYSNYLYKDFNFKKEKNSTILTEGGYNNNNNSNINAVYPKNELSNRNVNLNQFTVYPENKFNFKKK